MPVPYPPSSGNSQPFVAYPPLDGNPPDFSTVHMPAPNMQNFQSTGNENSIYPPPDYEASFSSRSPPRSPTGTPQPPGPNSSTPQYHPRQENQMFAHRHSLQLKDQQQQDVNNAEIATRRNSDRAHPPAPISTNVRSRKTPLVPVSPPDSPLNSTSGSTPVMTPGSGLAIDLEPAFVSELSREFKREIKKLLNLRELFFSVEYPESFTGREAVVSMSHAATRSPPSSQGQSTSGLDDLYNDLDSFITELQQGNPQSTPPHSQSYTPNNRTATGSCGGHPPNDQNYEAHPLPLIQDHVLWDEAEIAIDRRAVPELIFFEDDFDCVTLVAISWTHWSD
ncbi:hypothetical protein BC938DRAFT_477851 [Jimgerdemannia flammicorona]|uniref:Uncharacterized protein n=1 Tax=Jimgerdemannia flammicorona TaxID=994334 RepID=A0A433P7G1_9FUNG|nr:hypothetical protein BC938DRAFT_477851 [Jimgerdemannia flammicorona]